MIAKTNNGKIELLKHPIRRPGGDTAADTDNSAKIRIVSYCIVLSAKHPSLCRRVQASRDGMVRYGIRVA